eukprot:s899_g30.t1
MSRQFFPARPQFSGGGRGDSGLWKQMTPSKPPIQCFRCGGPHKLADCKEKPKNQEQSNTVTESAPFVFWNEACEKCDATTTHDENEQFTGTVSHEQGMITTSQAVDQGKAVIDGGATRTIGSIAALERVAELNASKRGNTGIERLDFSERPIFGFGNSSKNRCASTASLQVPMAGQVGSLKVHALDQGEAPVLLSVQSLRRLGAVIDYEHDLAVFRNVDPCRVVSLERSTAGHQLMPLTDDVYAQAKKLSKPFPALSNFE